MCFENRRASAIAVTLWSLVGGLIVVYLVLFAAGAAGRLARPGDEFTYGESWLLDGARRVARGEGLYAPADQIPLMHIAYTPLFYFVVGGLQRLVGDSGYTVGRVVSLVATCIGAGALAWSLRCLTARWSFGLLAAGFFLTQNLTALLWAPLHRADPLALGLTLVGLALATAGRASSAGIVLLLALLTKQTFVVAPIAVAIALWPCKAKLVRFGVIVLGGGVVALTTAQWLTGGWFLWHTVTANSNEPDLLTFAALMGSFLQYNGLPVIAALIAFTLPMNSGERLWRAYFVGCLATLPTLAKLGASSNYWLEVSAATAAILALASYRLAAWFTALSVADRRRRLWRRAAAGRHPLRGHDRPRARRAADRQFGPGRRGRQTDRVRVPDLPTAQRRGSLARTADPRCRRHAPLRPGRTDAPAGRPGRRPALDASITPGPPARVRPGRRDERVLAVPATTVVHGGPAARLRLCCVRAFALGSGEFEPLHCNVVSGMGLLRGIVAGVGLGVVVLASAGCVSAAARTPTAFDE